MAEALLFVLMVVHAAGSLVLLAVIARLLSRIRELLELQGDEDWGSGE